MIINTDFNYWTVAYLRKENRCLHAIRHNSIVNLAQAVALIPPVADLPAILDTFTSYANAAYKHSCRGGATKWRVNLLCKMASVGSIFNST